MNVQQALFKSAAMVGTNGKMENLALPMANAHTINTNMQRMGEALASVEKAAVAIEIPI